MNKMIEHITYSSATETDTPYLTHLLAQLFSIEKDFEPNATKQEQGLALLLKNQQTASIQVARDVSGKVITVLPSMRAQDQTAIVRAEVRSGVDQLFPSQMVDVIISSTANANVNSFKVPTSALVNHQSRVVVFVQINTGFEVREVKVLNTQGDITSISGDFNGTEKIVTSGTAAIKASWQGMGGE